MACVLLLLLVSALRIADAGAIPGIFTPTNANCMDYDVPVSISTTGIKFVAPEWADNIGLIDYVSLLTSTSSANIPSPVNGTISINGHYTISGTFWPPKAINPKYGNVLLATPPRFASAQDQKFKNLDAWYLIWVDVWGNINCFFKEPAYTWGAVQYADSIKAPLAVTEFVVNPLIKTQSFYLSESCLDRHSSCFYSDNMPSLQYIQNGEYEFLVCNGYCPGVNYEPARSLFAGSKHFNATIVPRTGHGLNYHTTAIEGCKSI